MTDTDIHTLFSRLELDSLQAEAPAPLYFQLYSLLKNRILNGAISHGARMPTEQQLAEAFSVSRITAKRAMDELAQEELVERKRGRGSHVTHQFEPEAVEAPLVGMLEQLASMGRHTRIKVLDLGMLIPPGDIRSELGLEKGEKAFRVVRVRSDKGGKPFAYYISWTKGIRHGFTVRNLEKHTRLDLLKKNGITISRVEQTIGATAAEEFYAEYIGLKPGQAVLTLLRRSWDADETVKDILYAFYNPKRFQYRMEMNQGGG